MNPQDDSDGYVYNRETPWRYSGLSAKFLGLDPWVIILIPITILGLRQQWGYPFLGFIILLLVMFIYVSMKGYPNVRVFFQSLGVRIIGRGRWKSR